MFVNAMIALAAFAAPPTPNELAASIDRKLEAAMTSAGVKPADVADDAEFFRRLSLDLCGRIPTAVEARTFLADKSPDKRERAIDRLLSRPRHASHLAAVWRGWLLPEITANPEARYFQIGFEAWLAERFHQKIGY